MNAFYIKLILNYIKKFFYFFLDKKVGESLHLFEDELNKEIKKSFFKNFFSSLRVITPFDQQFNFYLKLRNFLVKKKEKKEKGILPYL